MSKAKRMDQGKSPVVEGCFRYFPRALLAVGTVSAFGSNKYDVPLSDKNWLGLEQDRIVNSEGRHLLKEEIEGLYDSESYLLHKAHKAWNALADLEKELMKGTSVEKSDAFKESQDYANKVVAQTVEVLGKLYQDDDDRFFPDKGFKNKDWDGGEYQLKDSKLICDNCGKPFGKHSGTLCPRDM